jgi:hypothetical protein
VVLGGGFQGDLFELSEGFASLPHTSSQAFVQSTPLPRPGHHSPSSLCPPSDPSSDVTLWEASLIFQARLASSLAAFSQDPCPHPCSSTFHHPPPDFLSLDAQTVGLYSQVHSSSSIPVILSHSKVLGQDLQGTFGSAFPVCTHPTQNHTEKGPPWPGQGLATMAD